LWQLTNVARPVVPQQRFPRVSRQTRRRTTERSPDVPEKRLAEREHVGSSFAKRRNADVKHLQPVVQVLTEVAAFNCFLQVTVRRGHDADIRFLQPSPAKPLELALLQDAQKLGLRRQTHLADLVQEQHATRRELDLPGLRLLRARERAPFMPKELRLEQLFGQGGAVERDERAGLAG
jgi:hypothetical protein